jgi:hypothetical protein
MYVSGIASRIQLLRAQSLMVPSEKYEEEAEEEDRDVPRPRKEPRCQGDEHPEQPAQDLRDEHQGFAAADTFHQIDGRNLKDLAEGPHRGHDADDQIRGTKCQRERCQEGAARE